MSVFSLLRLQSGRLLLLLLALGLGHQSASLGPSLSPASTVRKAQSTRNYGSLPLSFEENQGQTNAPVRFFSHGPGYSIFLEDNKAVLLLSKSRAGSKHLSGSPGAEDSRSVDRLTDILPMRLVHARANLAPMGEDRLSATVNYFVGNNPANWRTRVPTFAKVRYEGVYPGVDLTYYGNGDRLEFDFDVAAGGSTREIRLRFDGARTLWLDREGNLVIKVKRGTISFRKPTVYQPDGKQGNHPIESAFQIEPDKTVGFLLGNYNHNKAIVIDPILNYSTYLGPYGTGNAIAVDAAGEAYVAGSTGMRFPTTGGIEPNPVSKVETSAYVAKFDSSGTGLLFSTYLSGSGTDAANAIAVDASGNAYITGTTSSTDFPVTQGALQTTDHEPSGTVFATKINSSGTALIYSTYLGGSTRSWGNGIAVDTAGDAYIAGATFDTDFPVTGGAFKTSISKTSAQDWTGFVSKLNPAGTKLVYSTYLGGSAADWAAAITLDANGDAYVVGMTGSENFPITPEAFQQVNKATFFNDQTAFAVKLNPAGTSLVYSTYLGGSVADSAAAVSVDATGNAYLTGYTESADFPVTPGVFQSTFHSSSDPVNEDAYITKLNSSGSALVYSTFLSGSSVGGGLSIIDDGSGVSVDGSGNAYVTGATNTFDFPVTPGALQPQNVEQLVSGDRSSFVAKINSTATKILYATYLAGSGDGSEMACDCTSGMALDPSGNVYVTGVSVSSDYPTTLGTFQTEPPAGGFTTIVTEFNGSEMTSLPTTTITLSSNPASQTFGQPITFTATVQPTSGSTPTGTVGFSFAGLESADAFPGQMGAWFSARVGGSGSATYTTSALAPGQITVNAYYLGDANNAPSIGSMTQTVVGIPTTATLTSSGNPEPYGTPVVFTATVKDTSGNPATGTVSFLMGNLSYAQVALNSSGQATWTNGTGGPNLPVGADIITADYYGYGYQQTAASLTETFTPSGITPELTFSPPAGTYTSAQSVELNDAAPAALIYYTTNGSMPIVGTSNQYPGVPLEVDTSETIKAIAVAPGYTASPVASAAYVINLTQPDFTVSLKPTALTVSSGQSGTTNVTVSPLDGFSQSVSLSCSGLPSGASCGFSPSSVTSSGSSILTITVSPATSKNILPVRFPVVPASCLVVMFGCVLFLRPRTRVLPLVLIACSVALLSLSACGGSGGGGQNPMPTVTPVAVIATSGALNHSVTLNLTVN